MTVAITSGLVGVGGAGPCGGGGGGVGAGGGGGAAGPVVPVAPVAPVGPGGGGTVVSAAARSTRAEADADLHRGARQVVARRQRVLAGRQQHRRPGRDDRRGERGAVGLGVARLVPGGQDLDARREQRARVGVGLRPALVGPIDGAHHDHRAVLGVGHLLAAGVARSADDHDAGGHGGLDLALDLVVAQDPQCQCLRAGHLGEAQVDDPRAVAGGVADPRGHHVRRAAALVVEHADRHHAGLRRDPADTPRVARAPRR